MSSVNSPSSVFLPPSQEGNRISGPIIPFHNCFILDSEGKEESPCFLEQLYTSLLQLWRSHLRITLFSTEITQGLGQHSHASRMFLQKHSLVFFFFYTLFNIEIWLQSLVATFFFAIFHFQISFSSLHSPILLSSTVISYIMSLSTLVSQSGSCFLLAP